MRDASSSKLAEADALIAQLGLENIYMLQGAFLDLFAPSSPMIDYNKGVVTFWGDGNRLIETTSVEGTARRTARVALDRNVPGGKFASYGDRLSFNEAADVAETLTGKTFERRSLGTEEVLRAALTAADGQDKIMLGYALYMTNGQTVLSDEQYGRRYPEILLQTFKVILAGRSGTEFQPAA